MVVIIQFCEIVVEEFSILVVEVNESGGGFVSEAYPRPNDCGKVVLFVLFGEKEVII